MNDAEPDGFGPPENFPSNAFNNLFQYPPLPFEDDLVQQYYPELLNPQLIDPQLANLDHSNLPQHHHHHHDLNNILDPQLENLFPKGISEQGNASYPGMAGVSNHSLLSSVRAWQDLIRDGGIENPTEQPLFLELMGELAERGVVSREWRWKVDTRDVDLGFVRVVA